MHHSHCCVQELSATHSLQRAQPDVEHLSQCLQRFLVTPQRAFEQVILPDTIMTHKHAVLVGENLVNGEPDTLQPIKACPLFHGAPWYDCVEAVHKVTRGPYAGTLQRRACQLRMLFSCANQDNVSQDLAFVRKVIEALCVMIGNCDSMHVLYMGKGVALQLCIQYVLSKKGCTLP